jgi:ribosomal 50S subunit-associated protein YjgA (DUF615 family)
MSEDAGAMSRNDGDDSRDDDRTARQLARRARRDAGARSAELATALMKLPDHAVARLELDDDLRATITSARAVTSPIARRRAERALAGELRRVDLDELVDQLAKLQGARREDTKLFHQAERLRARLIEEGMAAAAELPGGAEDPELPRLIDAAQRERATGRPPGAARALFRHVLQRLKAVPG